MTAAPYDPADPRPPRVQARPRPEDWGPKEAISLEEADWIYWPDGFFTAKTLYNEVKKKGLVARKIGRRYCTTRLAIEAMMNRAGIAGGIFV